MRLGVGSYSAAIAYPSGYSKTIPFTVAACRTTNVSLTTVTAVCIHVITAGPAGCTANVTITNNDTGAILGTGTITTVSSGGIPEGAACISIAEVAIGDFNNFGIGFVWTKFSVTSTSGAIGLACYSSAIPAVYDFRAFGAAC
jgi:hypothetical protein